MPKVSIIIPVYNSESYIDKCIKSCTTQTLKDIEIIFINDGSKDTSKDIIEKYQKKDNRIILYNQENGGQGKARNYGLNVAKGEYIAFVDSDDYVEDNMYETLYNRAKKDNYDIIICNYYMDYKDRIEKNTNNITSLEEKIITNEEYVTTSPGAWNKLIKREYILKNRFHFIEGIIYEDLASIPLLVLDNPKCLYINQCLYHYVQSDNSTVRNKEYKEKYENIFKAIEYLYDNLNNKGYDKELEYLIAYHFLYLGSLNFYKYHKYKNIDKIANQMKKYYPKWYQNNLVLNNFTKKQIIYMKLFYHKKYYLISIYRRLFARNEE